MKSIEELKEYMNDYLESLGVDTNKASRSNTVCPVCGGGVKTGCFTFFRDTNKVKCFSCGFNGDIVDLAAAVNDIDNKEAYALLNRIYDSNHIKTTKKPPLIEKEPPVDYTDYFLKAASNNDFKYLKSRGISEEVQKRFKVGYDPEWKSPTAVKRGSNPPATPRCIIPTSKYSYLARDIRSNLTDEEEKYKKMKEGNISFFNIEALKEHDVIFLTEGEIDAMSIEQAGGSCIGLGSTANRKAFINYIKGLNNNNLVFILFMDNDPRGRAAENSLKADIEALGLPVLEANYTAKDPNKLLTEDPEGLKELISSLKAEALDIEPPKNNEYNAGELLDYFRNIENQPEGFEVSTGFKELDRVLYGGLHEGLYVIGAISSLGKTSFCLQLADQIAEQGQDVLFFSLEMSKYELMAKSISRNSYNIAGLKASGGFYLARDTMQILNSKRYKYYTDEERQVIKKAIEKYQEEAKHLYIYEGRYQGQRLTVEHIKEIVKSHIEKTGRKPVVFVDYLQIIAPGDPHTTDKQATDTNVFELKELSRNNSIPVFVISSFNRDNYSESVNMTAFKESGCIEYSSDILIGLQYAGMDLVDSDAKKKKRILELMKEVDRKQKAKEPVEVEVKILKNRNGYRDKVIMQFMAAFNSYSEPYGTAAFQQFMDSKEKTPFFK